MREREFSRPNQIHRHMVEAAREMDDRRELKWSEIENDIQERATKKDLHFKLEGEWKKRVGAMNSFSIYQVDGEWVRNNLSVIFGHGGHGFVHEFIPLDEIWIADCHWDGCDCKEKTSRLSKKDFKSIALHEIKEFKAMEEGLPFYEAHKLAEE